MSAPAMRSHALARAVTGADRETELEVGLLWDSVRPEVVHIRLSVEGQKPVPWVIERETLAAGLDGPAGLGDVFVTPDLDKPWELVLLVVGSQSLAGTLRVELRYGFVEDFLARTIKHAPLGASSDVESAPWWGTVAGGAS